MTTASNGHSSRAAPKIIGVAVRIAPTGHLRLSKSIKDGVPPVVKPHTTRSATVSPVRLDAALKEHTPQTGKFVASPSRCCSKRAYPPDWRSLLLVHLDATLKEHTPWTGEVFVFC